MKAACLAVLFFLLCGGLFVWTTAPTSLDAPPVRSFAAPTASSTWWVGASSTDSSALPNTGVEGVIQVISTHVTGCLSFWVSDGMANGKWAQVGYFICDGSLPVAFYQIWNLGTNTVLAGGTGSISNGVHRFSMYLQTGTTWAYALDGTVMGTYNMGSSTSSSSYPVYALSEEDASSAFAFPYVTFSTAMKVLRSGTWSAVQTARSYGTAWGIDGNAQGGGLSNDQIKVGGSLAALPQGTLLWGSGSSTTTHTTTTTSGTVFTVSCVKASVTLGTASECRGTIHSPGSTPSGSLSWSSNKPGKFSSTTCQLVNGACSVMYIPTTSNSPVTITAKYHGDKQNSPASASFNLIVTKAPTHTTVTCTKSTLAVGTSMTCASTVSGPSSTHTGTITWMKVSGTGDVTFSSKICTLLAGKCSVTVKGTAEGAVTFEAIYSGDSNNLPSSKEAIYTVA